MKFQNYILPVFVSTNLLGQSDVDDIFPEIEFGFTHYAYTSVSFKSTPTNSILNKDLNYLKNQAKITEIQYGFGIGFFLWIPLNDRVVFKPKLEGSFSNSCLKQNKSIFATCVDLSISHGFAIALKPANESGIIYMARDMSCYLTSKQPYLLIEPKLNLKKFDAGYIHKGFQNELSLGFIVGYGINYEFHGTNFAPEITYCISSTAQNKFNDSKKIAHTITLALNFF
jgi:hypothetical protein